MKTLRVAGAIVVGIAVGGTLVLVTETLGHLVYPPPPGIDLDDPEQLKVLVASMPAGAMLLVALAWAVGSFGGGLVAALIGGDAGMTCALVVGGVLLLLGLLNLIMLPGHPVWFWIVGLAVFLPSAWLGGRLVRARRRD